MANRRIIIILILCMFCLSLLGSVVYGVGCNQSWWGADKCPAFLVPDKDSDKDKEEPPKEEPPKEEPPKEEPTESKWQWKADDPKAIKAGLPLKFTGVKPEYSFLYPTTLDDCKKRCEDTPECKMIFYSYNSAQRDPKDVICSMSSRLGDTIEEPDFKENSMQIVNREEAPAPQSSSSPTPQWHPDAPDVYLIKETVGTFGEKKPLSECQKWCEDTEGCTMIRHVSPDLDCTLGKTVGEKDPTDYTNEDSKVSSWRII